MSSPPLRTVSEWQRAMRDGHDPAPLLRSRLAAIRSQSPAEVWIHLACDAQIDAQLARLAERTARCDNRAAVLAAMPLFGVPFAVEDNIDIEGVPTTAACPAFAYLPQASAGAVQRLVLAGAVWLGKTNLDQFATGLVGTRSPHGRPASVADAQRISGGSSSGSAVAVARGDVAFSLGTDTAGSGRVPAGFNGIVGLKPTPGRVGTSGVLPACRTLDCVSVFAHGVADAAQVLAVIEGNDPADAYSAFTLGPATLPTPLRVGVPAAPEFFGDAGYQCGRHLRNALSVLSSKAVTKKHWSAGKPEAPTYSSKDLRRDSVIAPSDATTSTNTSAVSSPDSPTFTKMMSGSVFDASILRPRSAAAASS